MWPMHSIHPQIETIFVFTKDKNDELIDSFDTGIYGIKITEDLTVDSEKLKSEVYNWEKLLEQHVFVKNKWKDKE